MLTQATLGEVRLDFVQQRAFRGNTELYLTAKEFAMLRLLFEHPSEVISRDKFLDVVWGYTAFPTTRTVDKHIASLRAKIEKQPEQPRWIQTVHGVGYRLEVPPQSADEVTELRSMDSGSLGQPPLHFAAQGELLAVIDLLLRSGAKVDAVTSQGVTPLHLAVLKGYERVTTALLDAGAAVDAITSHRYLRLPGTSSDDAIAAGSTPLRIGTVKGYARIVELLLNRGADVNKPGEIGQSPLAAAVSYHQMFLPSVKQPLNAKSCYTTAGWLVRIRCTGPRDAFGCSWSVRMVIPSIRKCGVCCVAR